MCLPSQEVDAANATSLSLHDVKAPESALSAGLFVCCLPVHRQNRRQLQENYACLFLCLPDAELLAACPTVGR